MFIFVTDESDLASRHPLDEGETQVGRAPNCRILLNHGSVSRTHARFFVQGDSCTLEDRGSLNGTYVNGALITIKQVRESDRIIFGSVPGRIEMSAEDRLTLVDGSGVVPVPVVIQRPVDQAPAQLPSADAGRLMLLISELARTLVKNPPLSETLNHIVQLTLDSIRAERGFLVLKDEKTNQLVPRVARTRDRDLNKGSISATIVNRVMEHRIALLATDTQREDFESVQSIRFQKIRGFVCAPLWNQDTTIGALYLDTFYSNVFVPADLELLTTLSNYAALAIEQSRLATRLLQETRRRERLGRYHSPSVVKRILDEGTDAEVPFLAQEREITVLFADIVGFTSMAERMPPPQVAAMLNRYFGRMTDIVFQHDGTLDKFIGDALLAVFGAPLDQPDHAERAIATAKAMRVALAKLNAEADGPPIQARIAINSGVALAGDIGAASRRDYTVLGDVVNTASRIETTVAGPDQIILTRGTCDRLTSPHTLRSMGPITLRGRQEPIELFELGEDG